ncbi:MAG: baseplate J/gp47 family protein [Oscillibacter sp.]
MVADYEAAMTASTGATFSLDRASVHRMELYAAAAQIYQAMQYIDRAGKQNLLKYSYSDWLDNVGLLKSITRLPAAAATTTLRFTLSAARTVATGIPQGTRVASGGSVYFATREYVEIPAGGTTAEVAAVCTTTGTEGNGMAVGELSTIVDPVPYVAGCSNTTPSEGGAEIEQDKDLAERIYLAPGAYSTAGPEDGYLYHAKRYNGNVGDVVATSDQAAGTVDIVFLMSDGAAPGKEMIAGLQGYLRDGNIRPMTDLVKVSAPTEVTYTINLTYYINRSAGAQAVAIQEAVKTAVSDYTVWQRTIGRDINPSKLVALVMAAGAKRVTVTAPTHTTVARTAVAALSAAAVISYGGLEDD